MKTNEKHSSFAFSSSEDAIQAMTGRLDPIELERVALTEAFNRVLAEPIVADRPSPACDVSAMDGYAIRLSDVAPVQPLDSGEPPRPRQLAVTGEVANGQPPPAMPSRAALRIFTGGPVPAGCDAVIPREQVKEGPESIALAADLAIQDGQHIRRCGENGRAGETIVQSGTPITPTVAAALATCGVTAPLVYRRVRLSVIVTGNEVNDVAAQITPWQLRDSNGPALAAMFAHRSWIHWQGIHHVMDDPIQLRETVATVFANADALLLTGGVSMGDYDFVPTILTELGCDILFHKLPIRPGKPILGAIGPLGQAVLGLPGNPVSVMTTGRRIALPILRHRAGFAQAAPPTASVTLDNPDDKQLPLHWSRPVRLTSNGKAERITSRGSGDIISAARSDGFIEIPASETGSGPWPFYSWRATDE